MERDGKLDVQFYGPISVGVSRREVIEGPTGRGRRTKAERARIAVESLIPGTTVTDVAQRHEPTRWQVYDWRKKLRLGKLVVPESMTALPMFAELVAEDNPLNAPSGCSPSDVEIVVGDVVIRAGAGADERQLTRAIRAAIS